jgi:hypothetical protein
LQQPIGQCFQLCAVINCEHYALLDPVPALVESPDTSGGHKVAFQRGSSVHESGSKNRKKRDKVNNKECHPELCAEFVSISDWGYFFLSSRPPIQGSPMLPLSLRALNTIFAVYYSIWETNALIK